MKKTILVFGAISGLIISTFMGASMAIMGCSGGDPGKETTGMIIGFSAMAVAFSFIFVGIKNYRDKESGGVLTFGKAFQIGFLISLIASTLYVLTWAVEFHFFMPDFMDKYSAMQAKEVTASGLTGDALSSALKSIESDNYSYKHNPFFFAAYTYMEILPVGIIITLISSFILKRKTAVAN